MKIKKIAAASGLIRALVNNMVTGVSKGFEKNMEIVGVGYRVTAAEQGRAVPARIFAPDSLFASPRDITIEVLEATKFKIKGINKQQVGQVAANITKAPAARTVQGKGHPL